MVVGMAFRIMLLALRLGERHRSRDASYSDLLWTTLSGNNLRTDWNSGCLRLIELLSPFQLRELVITDLILRSRD